MLLLSKLLNRLFFYFFFKDFIYLFDRERSQVGREAGRERERERGGSRLSAEQRAWCGTRSQDSEIMTWAEGSGLTHWATQAPYLKHFKDFFFLRFYLFIWQREVTSRWRGRQRERGKQALCWAESLMRSSIPGPWIMTRAEGSGLIHWATQAPLQHFLI